MEKFCDNCEEIVFLTEDGYCRRCGIHADNMNKRQQAQNRNFGIVYGIGTRPCDNCHDVYTVVNENRDSGFCSPECEEEDYQRSYYRR